MKESSIAMILIGTCLVIGSITDVLQNKVSKKQQEQIEYLQQQIDSLNIQIILDKQ